MSRNSILLIVVIVVIAGAAFAYTDRTRYLR